jgi:MFS-type transporter involved in bile tolerance (Atg22 family)
MPMKSFFLILVAGLILSVGNGFRMSLGIYVPDLLSSTVFGASMIGLTYGIFNLLWGCMSPIAGAFAEQKGYVKTLMVGFIGISLSFYITSSAYKPSSLSFWFRGCWRFVRGYYFCSCYYWRSF